MPSLRPDCAMLISFHSADSINTSVVCSEQPQASPPMMPTSDSTPSSSAITHIPLSRVFALDGADGRILELAHVGGGKVAGDAMRAGAIRPVRRQIDFEHGIAEPGP